MFQKLGVIAVLFLLASSTVLAGSFFEGSVWDSWVTGDSVSDSSDPWSSFTGFFSWFNIFATKASPSCPSEFTVDFSDFNELTSICSLNVKLVGVDFSKTPYQVTLGIPASSGPTAVNGVSTDELFILPFNQEVALKSNLRVTAINAYLDGKGAGTARIRVHNTKLTKAHRYFALPSGTCWKVVQLAAHAPQTVCGKSLALNAVAHSNNDPSIVNVQFSLDNHLDSLDVGHQQYYSSQGLFVYAMNASESAQTGTFVVSDHDIVYFGPRDHGGVSTSGTTTSGTSTTSSSSSTQTTSQGTCPGEVTLSLAQPRVDICGGSLWLHGAIYTGTNPSSSYYNKLVATIYDRDGISGIALILSSVPSKLLNLELRVTAITPQNVTLSVTKLPGSGEHCGGIDTSNYCQNNVVCPASKVCPA